MCGIFSGLREDDQRRDAAWKYISFFDGPEARRIRTESLVEGGLGPFVRKRLLERFNTDGRYDAIIRQVPPELEEMYRIAFNGGVPEPYGKNCGDIYTQMNRPLGAIWSSDIVRRAIDDGRPDVAKTEIRAILKRATVRINQKLLGNLPAPVQQKQDHIAWAVIIAVIAIFAGVMWRVTHLFKAPEAAAVDRRGGYRRAYLLMAPALLSIAVWMYWPLLRGSIIAFQDYSVIDASRWVGSANFSTVLFDPEFWFSLRISIIYALLFIAIGFWAPIALALLLQEVPRGSTFFRIVFYLPAVLSGVVVIFLWKSFYAPQGLVNQIINLGVWRAQLPPGRALPGIQLCLARTTGHGPALHAVADSLGRDGTGMPHLSRRPQDRAR